MKLIHAPASPFARKAVLLVIELELEGIVELIEPGAVTPVSNNDMLNLVNPLGMIPALTLDNGDSLYDSPVICEYLNHLKQGPFFPEDPIRRFRALQLQALADGIMELSVALRYETAMRPAELQWQAWIDHQAEKIERALLTLERQCAEFDKNPTIGELAVACALGYRDFRFAEINWRAEYPKLAQWYSSIMQRNSLRSTIPG